MANVMNFYNMVKQDVDKQKRDYLQTTGQQVNAMFGKRIFDLQKTKEEQKVKTEKAADVTQDYKIKAATAGIPWNEAWNSLPPDQITTNLIEAGNTQAIDTAQKTMPSVWEKANTNKEFGNMTPQQKVEYLNTIATNEGLDAKEQREFNIWLKKEQIRVGNDLYVKNATKTNKDAGTEKKLYYATKGGSGVKSVYQITAVQAEDGTWVDKDSGKPVEINSPTFLDPTKDLDVKTAIENGEVYKGHVTPQTGKQTKNGKPSNTEVTAEQKKAYDLLLKSF
jgi:hypothetical protein